MKTLMILSLITGLVLLSASSISYADAKPIRGDATIGNAYVECSENRGILTCTVSSTLGGPAQGVSLADPDGYGLCDQDADAKKRISVTTRNSPCIDPFDGTRNYLLIIQKIEGIPVSLNLDIIHTGTTITIQ